MVSFRVVVGVLVAVAAVAVLQMQPSRQQSLASLRGKSVLVCGGSVGIGRSMALLYAASGANVVVTSRTQAKLDEVKQAAARYPGKIHPIAADLTDLDQVTQLIAKSKQLVGPFDIVVLNHIKPYFQLFEDTDLKTLREVVDVDLYSYITITKLLLQELIARDATLVAVSSAAGKIGVPYAAVYSASKHALHGFFDSLRLEVYMTHPSSKMSITTCVIGNIDTESAKRVTAGKVRHPTRASPDDTALAIVTGALRKQREVYFPRLEVTPIPYLRAFFPSLTDYLIVNSMEAPPNRDSSLPSGAGAN